MAQGTHTFSAAGIELTLDLSVGHIASLAIDADGQRLCPLHRAPWINDPEIQRTEEIALSLRRLSGDFFCAPFGRSDVEESPGHGWSANSEWVLVDVKRLGSRVTATYELLRPIMGAKLFKELSLVDHHPFLYQKHTFEGGRGRLSAGHHPMVHMSAGGSLSFSPKRWAQTNDNPIETDPKRGRHALRYPASADLGSFPLAKGGTVDLRRYPPAEGHEDFVTLVEAANSKFGWSAALRSGERDVVLFLKDPGELPVTMLWMSNAGRDYSPWLGRHRGVLGIEDGCCYLNAGHAAALASNSLSEAGIPTNFELHETGTASFRHVIGAWVAPPTWNSVLSVEQESDRLIVRGDGHAVVRLPFDSDFLARASNVDRQL
ncbi:hypothetical protein [Bradyrhizobium ottawaense]|uniref:hypothetical protein n=1 Tax=Bradyrhizobium ottawaense TaxID=931866 RepID=UPI00384F222C